MSESADPTPEEHYKDKATRLARIVAGMYGMPPEAESSIRAAICETAASAAFAAMLRERERAAKAADAYGAGFDDAEREGGRAVCPKCGEYARNVADDIAESIRSGR